jgi:cytochrome c5
MTFARLHRANVLEVPSTMRRLHVPALLALAAASFLPLIAAQSAEPRSGAILYDTYCASCHSGGWQGAPVANDAAEWGPRLEKGRDTVFSNVKNGLNAMPPMGTCNDCTDAELQAAIDEMTK